MTTPPSGRHPGWMLDGSREEIRRSPDVMTRSPIPWSARNTASCAGLSPKTMTPNATATRMSTTFTSGIEKARGAIW